MSKSSSGIIAVTVMWLLTMPGALYFLTKVLQFPWDLTLLLLVPVFIIWVPASYSLIAATNRTYEGGEQRELPSAARLLFGLLGVLTAVLSSIAIMMYLLYRSTNRWGAVGAGFIGLLCLLLAFRVLRQAVKKVTDNRGTLFE